MNTRPLDKSESERLKELNEAGLESAQLYLTETGLRKNILDATAPLRDLFLKQGWHCYKTQGQGTGSKVVRQAVIFHHGKALKIDVSLYRPETKKGDPRIWPYKLNQYANPEHVLALFFHDNQLHIVNLSAGKQVELTSNDNDLSKLLLSLQADYNAIADELLQALKQLAQRGPILAVGTGDTAIGRTIESALGISMNASRKPDYKGIELKAKRTTSTTRNGLFAQVPDWRISKLKSFKEMVLKYGYEQGDQMRLYCTCSARGANPQGLLLKVDNDLKQLDELHRANKGETLVCAWELQRLHARLSEKHRETFWIGAEQINTNGEVRFRLDNVRHTRRPSMIQFDRLLSDGEISVDHMIKLQNGRCHEKGPQFKVQRGSLNELFLGAERQYQLP